MPGLASRENGRFRFAIAGGIIDAIVDGIECLVGTGRVEQVEYPDATHQAMFRAAILQLDEINFPGILFILHTIIKYEKAGWSILQHGARHVPKSARGEFSMCEEVADRIMAHRRFAFQVIGQMRTRIIVHCGNQIFNVLLFREHGKVSWLHERSLEEYQNGENTKH